MDLLAASLRYWVSWKLNNDPGWKNVSIVQSGNVITSAHAVDYFCSSKSSSPMRQFLEKESTRSWTGFVEKGVIQSTTRILATSSMVS